MGFAFSSAALDALSGNCLCLRLRKATRQVTRLYDNALVAHGLTVNQFGIMGYVQALGGASLQTLADRLSMDQSALSRSLKPLERAGLVTSRVDRTDRRRRLIVLTGEGRRRFDEAARSWQVVQTRVIAAFGDELTERMRALSGAAGRLDRPKEAG